MFSKGFFRNASEVCASLILTIQHLQHSLHSVFEIPSSQAGASFHIQFQATLFKDLGTFVIVIKTK